MRLPPERPALVLVLIAGAALRLWQYLARTSLWIDEIALAENVIHEPLSSLAGRPLALDQVAPPGFLALLKGAVEVFGPGELALRLVPLMGALGALGLFAVLARRILPAWPSLFAVALFALSPQLIAYGAEVKQYSTDVAASILLTLVALDLCGGPPPRDRLVRAGLIGWIAVWFSQPAVLVVAGLGAGLARIAISRGGRAALKPLFPLLAVWAAGAAGATLLGFHNLSPGTREYMKDFWQAGLPRATVIGLVLLGSAVLWYKRPQSAPLLLGPVGVALAAAAAHLYPFSGRAILFLTPVALLAAADAVDSLVAGLGRLGVPRPLGASVFAIGLAVTTLQHLPVYRKEETRTVLAELARRRQPGDAVYVYYGAERALRFYGPRVGIEPSSVTFGGCHRGEPREYLRELDRLRGARRVWVVMAHAVPGLAEQKTIRGYLERIGARQDRIEAVGADAELYDLGEAGRPEDSSAATHPVPPADPEVVARFGCGHGPLATDPADWN